MGAVPGVRQDGPGEILVSWVALVVSGVLEAVWATALDKSEGFSKPSPSVVFLVALVASMGGIGLRDAGPAGRDRLRRLGGGSAQSSPWSTRWRRGDEPASLLKAAFLVMIIGGVVGLKLAH